MVTFKKSVHVVHFSVTPLAGAPIRLVQALNRLTDTRARLVDLERFGLYDHDIIFSEAPDDAQDLVNNADILHLHNYLDCESNQFAPIDFKALLNAGKLIIRHYHSTSDWIAQQMGMTVEELLECRLPSLVIAQYPERFFIKSRVVPNLIPHSDPLYIPCRDREPEFDIFFSPTKTAGAFEQRWDTKAAPEVTELIHKVAARTGCSFKIMTGQPLKDALRAKQLSRIVIDDLVTGSYHLTGLEGLSQGKPVLSFIDERNLALLRHVSGSEHCPFINVRLEDAETVLLYLLEHPADCQAIGEAGRRWLLKYWNEVDLIKFFHRAYVDLLDTPSTIKRQPELDFATEDRRFQNFVLPDLIFQARKYNYSH